MKVYMYEYKAPGYYAASKFIPQDDLIGSEYFGPSYKGGEYVDGIRHEDAAHLSFDDNSLDIMVSLDVFEHIYFYKQAFQEIFRVLKPGGQLLMTLPMQPGIDKKEDRAKIVNGETIFLKEPIYHGGNSETDFGVLEYTTFGWDIIPFIKSVGFSDVKLIAYYSINDGYLGLISYYFHLIK